MDEEVYGLNAKLATLPSSPAGPGNLLKRRSDMDRTPIVTDTDLGSLPALLLYPAGRDIATAPAWPVRPAPRCLSRPYPKPAPP